MPVQIPQIHATEEWHSPNVDTWRESISAKIDEVASSTLTLMSFAAYQGLTTGSTPIAMADISATWQTVPFSSPSLATGRGIVANTTNNTLAIAYDGVYAVQLMGNLQHNEAQGGRNTFVRFYDVTAAAPDPMQWRLFTARNVTGTVVNYSALAEIAGAQKGHEFRVEVGGGSDAYSSVDWQGEFSIYSVGEWREPDFPEGVI